MLRLTVQFVLCLWMLPVAIPIWILYLWPAEMLGLIDRVEDEETGVAMFLVKHKGWLWSRLWRRWNGHALPGAVVINGRGLRLSKIRTVVGHEMRHAHQWQALGPLFPAAYLLFLVRFGYKAHPLERDAGGTKW